MKSAFLIIPTNLKVAADKLGEAMGWGPENYTIQLSNDSGVTVTHYACRTDVRFSFQVTLMQAGYDLTRAGISEEEIEQVRLALSTTASIPEGADIVINNLDVNLSTSLWGLEHATSVIEEKNYTIVWS